MPINSSTSFTGDPILRLFRLGMRSMSLMLGFGGGCIRRDSLMLGIRDGDIRSLSGEGRGIFLG